MHKPKALTTSARSGFRLAVAAAALFALTSTAVRADDTTPAKPAKKSEGKSKKLGGAELYQIHCNRCHPERYATEWNPAQWKTLMLHMRVRANLPASQAKAILKYLQEDAGN